MAKTPKPPLSKRRRRAGAGVKSNTSERSRSRRVAASKRAVAQRATTSEEIEQAQETGTKPRPAVGGSRGGAASAAKGRSLEDSVAQAQAELARMARRWKTALPRARGGAGRGEGGNRGGRWAGPRA